MKRGRLLGRENGETGTVKRIGRQSEAPLWSEEDKRRGAMKKSRAVKVAEGKEVVRDEPIKYFRRASCPKEGDDCKVSQNKEIFERRGKEIGFTIR